MAKIDAPDSPFLAALQEGYVDLAERELAEFDWSSGARFRSRALAAAQGTAPLPFDPSEQDIPERAIAGLIEAYVELTGYLGSEGAMLRAGRQIGEAQVQYDCWVQEAEEGHQTEDIDACREAYQLMIILIRDLAALPDNMAVVLPEEPGNEVGGIELAQGGKTITLDSAFAAAGVGEDFGDLPVTESEIRDAFAGALAAQPKPPKEFQLNFPFNGTRISDEAFEAILAAAEEARSRDAAEVIVTGYADLVGNAADSLAISRTRAERVRQAIFWELRDKENVTFATDAKGERDPVEDTARKSEANRRVVVLVR
ncbi:MAG: OmpA family protein [Pseudomonadota bacterium]